MKRAALHESIRRGLAIHMATRFNVPPAELAEYVADGMKVPICHAMADRVVETIDVEHPGAIEP